MLHSTNIIIQLLKPDSPARVNHITVARKQKCYKKYFCWFINLLLFAFLGWNKKHLVIIARWGSLEYITLNLFYLCDLCLIGFINDDKIYYTVHCVMFGVYSVVVDIYFRMQKTFYSLWCKKLFIMIVMKDKVKKITLLQLLH